LGNAPENAKYTSHQIQKEILHVFARNVQSQFVMSLVMQDFV
jgi:hypothetical protein